MKRLELIELKKMYLKILLNEERNKFFGKAPATVYENLVQLDSNPSKLKVLKRNNVFTDAIINSFKLAAIERWSTEITKRVISNYMDEVRSFKPIHSLDKVLDLDVSNWMKLQNLRYVYNERFLY